MIEYDLTKFMFFFGYGMICYAIGIYVVIEYFILNFKSKKMEILKYV